MFEAPYRNDKPYDEYLESTFKSVNKHISSKNDDFLCLTVGDTGGGKSMLNLHILTIYMPEEMLSINQVALSREEFATSLKDISEAPKPRALLYDEANVNKRDSMTGWNKDIMDLYFSCRGLNVLHLWANPSLNLLDKAFIEDRLRAVILVKGKGNIRYYYYFRKADILDIFRKYGNLNLDLISRVRKKYAWYRGWFRDYNGSLKAEYLEKKENRMMKKVKNFFEKYGDDGLIKRNDLMKALMISESTFKKHMDKLVPEKHIIISGGGRIKFTQDGAEEMKRILIESRHAKAEKIRVSVNKLLEEKKKSEQGVNDNDLSSGEGGLV